MASFLWHLIVLLAVVATGLPQTPKVSLGELCQDPLKQEHYTDAVLSNVRKTMEEEGPYRMEDDIRRVSRLYDGKIFNLHNFRLRHPASIFCDQQGEKALLTLLLAFNSTKVHYMWNFAGISFLTGGFWTFADRITTEVLLSAPLNQNKAVSFTVDSVRVTELGGIWVRVDGVQPFSAVASQIGNLGTMISRGTLKTFLQSNLKTIFNEAFSKHQL